MENVVLNNALRSTVLSLQRTSRSIDLTSLRLATGLKVNSALDNPQNFFASSALSNEASDYNRLLDGIGQSARTVEEALIGVEATERLIDQAEAVVTESLQIQEAGGEDDKIFEFEKQIVPPSLDRQILGDQPDFYYRLNDGGATADDSGLAGGNVANYTGGVVTGAPPIYSNGGTASADFDGVNDRVRVADNNLINLQATNNRTVELVFNADDVTSRQILYEEGATVNSLAIYINNGEIFVVGTDQGAWGPNSSQGPNNIRAPIVAGETYHVAFVYTRNGTFEGFLNGVSIGNVAVPNVAFPAHSGDIGIGGLNGGVWFDDFSTGANNGFNFDGRISDVAIYNRSLSGNELLSHFNSLEASTSIELRQKDFEKTMDQIERLAIDAQYRGINLLAGDNLSTIFNPDRTSNLITEGADFINFADSVPRADFTNLDTLREILERLSEFKEEVREFGQTLVSDLNVIQTREIYTRAFVNTLESGADDLVVANQNEEGANLLAAQTRQELGVTALNLAAISATQTLRLF